MANMTSTTILHQIGLLLRDWQLEQGGIENGEPHFAGRTDGTEADLTDIKTTTEAVYITLSTKERFRIAVEPLARSTK